MRFAQLLDPFFTIDNVVFTPKQFMDLITDGMKKGSIIIFDEAGVGMPSREWYSLSNKMLSYVLQTFRFMNLGVIFTTPSIGFIDAQARRLFHMFVQTEKVDRRKKRVRARIKEMQHNPQMDKIYYKNPRKHKLDTETEAISNIWIAKPSEKLVKAYEKKKEIYAGSLFTEIDDDITKLKIKGEVKKPLSDEEVIAMVLEKIPQEEITIAKIAAITGIAQSRARKIRAKIIVGV